jgi:hypothetical protein
MVFMVKTVHPRTQKQDSAVGREAERTEDLRKWQLYINFPLIFQKTLKVVLPVSHLQSGRDIE